MKTKGFTLVEVLVAMAIFSIVAVIAVGAFVVVISSGQRVQNTRRAVDDLGFVVQDIVRESRLAVNHWCGDIDEGPDLDGDFVVPTECLDGNSHIAFNALVDGEAGDVIEYQISDEGRIQKSVDFDPWVDLTSDELSEVDLAFILKDQQQNDQISQIIIRVSATVGLGTEEEAVYEVQTSVHPRFPEYKNPNI